jgi:beta-mannosidase
MADWQLCSTEPDAALTPEQLQHLDVEWLPAQVPGTAASALRAIGHWGIDDERDFDATDWWWRTTVVAASDADIGSWQLVVGGVATFADVWFDGRLVLHSENMFLAHTVDLGPLASGRHDVAIRCAALAPVLAVKRQRPRWKTRLVRQQTLRWIRTTLLGRIPGWSPTGAPVGPWRGCELVLVPDVLSARVRARCDGSDGVVDVTVQLRTPPVEEAVSITIGDRVATAHVDGDVARATVRVTEPERWWPHTHGTPSRYEVSLSIGDRSSILGRIGFRAIEVDTADGGFALRVNDDSVFCRGASWMPIDPVSLTNDSHALRHALEDVRRANMNMVRLSGTSVYEDDEFYELCDELGILVWQDVMWANMDPPDDPDFVSSVEAEVAQLLDRVGHRPSLAVLCGGSEVEQQAAMLGLPRDRWTMPLFDEVLSAVAARTVPGLAYVTSSPTGGALPFHSDVGVAHYFGVGAYRRPITDARRAGVRFAAECLAFSNAPDDFTAEQAASKFGVPRDNGTDWDFADITDHYVRELFGADPDALRQDDPDRYLDLGRAAVGELIEATFGEWRRVGSSCAGGLVWWLRDLRAGAGWGIVDSSGKPKAPWWYARRAMAPIALLATDEGLNGLHLHVVNDTNAVVEGALRVELFTRGERLSETGEQTIKVAGHGAQEFSADAMFDGFRDLTYAYRFGDATYDVIAATLVNSNNVAMARAVHLPLGLARERETDVGLSAVASPIADGRWKLDIQTSRFAQSVALRLEGYRPDDNWFHLAPGATRTVLLELLDSERQQPTGDVRAINALARCRISADA